MSRLFKVSGIFSALALISAPIVGCSSEDAPDSGVVILADSGPADTGSNEDAAAADTGRRDTGTGGRDQGVVMEDAGPVTDMNDSFAEAVVLTVGNGAGASGVINPAGDHDFYSFMGTADTWVIIATRGNPNNEPGKVDTVVTLFDATMNKVAEDDDGRPFVSTDSEVIFHIPANGMYYVEVQEYSSWAMGETPEGQADYTYTIAVVIPSPAVNGFVQDLEGGDNAASAIPLEFATRSLVFGTFRDGTDIDVYSLRVPGTAVQSFSAYLLPGGPDFNGGSGPGDMWVTDAAGTNIIARIDTTAGNQLDPPLAPGDYLLWVSHPATAGTNDYYVLKPRLGGENDPETQDATNGVRATAEPLVLVTDAESMTRAGFFLAQLGANDVDYFSFDLLTDEHLAVNCGSATSGSGVRGLLARVETSTGGIAAMQEEVFPDSVIIDDAVRPITTSTATFYLRLSKTSQDPAVSGTFVRCGIRAFLMP